MKPDMEGFLYPEIDVSRCVACKLCAMACPVTSKPPSDRSPKAYACRNKDDRIRYDSSSGGLFTPLAERILRKSGVVFGAAFDASFNVVHDFAETADDLSRLRQSKYAQSRMGKAYARAKACLDAGRYVYFSGTPCQIAGLQAYLGKDCERLICQDLICHGVPSPKVWRDYLSYRERRSGAPVRAVQFREKRQSWSSPSTVMRFENGKEYRRNAREDLFCRGFLENLFLRPSCFSCPFKGSGGSADITLADFWGVDRVLPELFDDRGTSLLLIHSQKGADLFDCVREELICEEVSPAEALRHNPLALASARPPAAPAQFWETYHRRGLPKTLRAYLKVGAVIRCKRLARRVVNKISRRQNVAAKGSGFDA
jgi:coenzyme F420-reducing hydrogenase beta subunit